MDLQNRKKILSLFGENTEPFQLLNGKAEEYAQELGFEYQWLPLEPFDMDSAVRALSQADVGIIDVQPYNQQVFERFSDKPKLLVRFGVG